MKLSSSTLQEQMSQLSCFFFFEHFRLHCQWNADVYFDATGKILLLLVPSKYWNLSAKKNQVYRYNHSVQEKELDIFYI